MTVKEVMQNDVMKKNFKRFLLIGLLFFAVTMPFRQLMHVISVTEIRPACAFPPVFGLLYGWAGILACAVSNLAADILSGYSPVLCAEGFVIQVIFGFLPYWIWKKLGGEVDLKSAGQLLRYNTLIILDAIVTAVLIGLALQTNGIAPVFSITTLFLFMNNYVFGIALGQPIIVLRSMLKNVLAQKKARGSMHEQFIMLFLALGILSAAIISIFAYKEAHHRTMDAVSFWNTVYIYISVDAFLFSTANYFCLKYVEKNITRPVEGLASVAREYVQKGLVKSDTNTIQKICEQYKGVYGEAGDLANAYGSMLKELELYIDNLTKVTAEKERISAELNVAAQIQADMLPNASKAFPERSEFKIDAIMDPAKEVGGDFYDFFLIDEDHLALVIADVSGKGVPAALFMVIAKTMIKNRAQMGGSPAEILSHVNNQLCEGNEEGYFVTVWMAIVEISTGKIVDTNAGHEHPVLCRKDGKYEPVQYRHNIALAMMEDTPYKEHEFQLLPGDTLFVYTDGVTEATNEKNELFGKDRMLEALNRHDYADGTDLLAGVREEMDVFVNGAPQFDDITMLCFSYYGPNVEKESYRE